MLYKLCGIKLIILFGTGRQRASKIIRRTATDVTILLSVNLVVSTIDFKIIFQNVRTIICLVTFSCVYGNFFLSF